MAPGLYGMYRPGRPSMTSTVYQYYLLLSPIPMVIASSCCRARNSGDLQGGVKLIDNDDKAEEMQL